MEKSPQVRVGVIFGGRSGEHEVSLMSARSILDALDPLKYEVFQIGITHDGQWVTGPDVLEAMLSGDIEPLFPATMMPDPARSGLYRIRMTSLHGESLEKISQLDVVIPVLHGTFGEDGTLQGLLELQDTAYVGAGVLGSALGMDKGVFRDVMIANGIPVLDTVVVLRSEVEADLDGLAERVEQALAGQSGRSVTEIYPLFVKPANLGSSVGISKCRSRSDLVEGLMDAARYDRRLLIQRGINGREIEVSVLGNDRPEASLPGEIVPSREFYSYEAKYIDERSELLIPAPISAEQTERVRHLAVKAYQAVDASGMARADFLLDRDTNELYLSEINTIPGFTKISMYPKLWEASGMPYPALLDRLIDLSLERKAERDRTERRFRPS